MADKQKIIKKDIATKVSNMAGLDITQAELAVRVVFDTIREAIAEGIDIEIRDFGSFRCRVVEERVNSRRGSVLLMHGKGTPSVIPAQRKVRFVPGKILQERMKDI